MSKLINKESFVGKIVSFIPGSLLPAITALLSMSIFTRILNSDEYGKYSLALSFVLMVFAVSSQWLQQAINRFLPGETDKNKIDTMKQSIILGLFLICLLLGFFALICLTIFRSKLALWNDYFLPVALLVYSTLFYQTVSTLLQAQLRGDLFSVFNSVNAVVKFLFGFLLISFLPFEGEGLIWAAFLSQIILTIYIVNKFSFPSIKGIFRNKNVRSQLMEFFSYGTPMIGWFLSSSILDIGSRFVIQYYHGSSEVGIYSASYNLIQGGVGLVAAPVLLAAHPFLMKAWGENDIDKTKYWLKNIISWFWIFIFILCGLVWFFSNEISFLFLGKDFAEGKTIMPIILGGFVFWQLGSYAHKPLEFHNKTLYLMFLNLLVAVINLIINFLLVPKWGYIGSAYATLISFFLYYVIVSVSSKKLMEVSLDITTIVRYLSLIIAFFGASYLLINYFGNELGFYTLFIIKMLISGIVMGYIILKITKKYLLNDSGV